jgi:hypothetical protein
VYVSQPKAVARLIDEAAKHIAASK